MIDNQLITQELHWEPQQDLPLSFRLPKLRTLQNQRQNELTRRLCKCIYQASTSHGQRYLIKANSGWESTKSQTRVGLGEPSCRLAN
jgi:hypothetical protein